MKRKRQSTRDRVKLFDAHKGRCHLCGLIILAGERWEVSHVIALELGGEDDHANCAPAHALCHRKHTSTVDAPAIAKSKRIRARHIGAHTSRSPMPCGRKSQFKKRMDGTVVRRTK